jgi:hypothetical protein
MRRSEWEDAGVIDQNVDMATAQLDGAPGEQSAREGGRDKVRRPTAGSDAGDNVLASLHISARENDVGAVARQVDGNGASDAAAAAGYQRCLTL